MKKLLRVLAIFSLAPPSHAALDKVESFSVNPRRRAGSRPALSRDRAGIARGLGRIRRTAKSGTKCETPPLHSPRFSENPLRPFTQILPV